MNKNHIFIEKKIDEQGNETEEEIEIEPENFQWALEQPNFEPADEFDDPEGNTVVVPVSSFKNALDKGYKPKRPDPGAWEAFKTGWHKTLPMALGMEGFTSTGTPFGVDTAEEELAWERNPIPYSVGRIGAGLALGLAGGGAAYGAGKMAKKGVQKTAPVLKPAIRAGTEAAKETMKSAIGMAGAGAAGMGLAGGDIPDVTTAALAAGLGTAAIRGGKAAFQQLNESRQLKREIARLSAQGEKRPVPLDPQRPPGSANRSSQEAVKEPGQALAPLASTNRPRPQKQPILDSAEMADVVGLTRSTETLEEPLPTIALMDPTEKSTMIDWLATKAGGGGDAANLLQKDIKKAASMGIKRRFEGYNFDPAEEARALAPQVQQMLGTFESERSNEFRNLFRSGIAKWEPQTAIPAIATMQQIKKKADEWGATGAKPALSASEQIILRGEMFTGDNEMLPMTPGISFTQASKEEKFNRLWNARKHIQETLRKAGSREITLGSVQAERALKQVEQDIQRSMHSQPEILEADKMWTQTSQAREGFFEPLEFKPGTPAAKIDAVSLEKLFRQSEMAKRFPESIGLMREVLTKYSQKYPEAKKLLDTVNNVERAMKVREDQRFLERFRQAQGPTSPMVETGLRSMERSPEILSEAGISPRLLRNPSAYIKGLDELSVQMAQKYFGKKPWDLNTTQKNALIRLHNWHQEQGLKATPKAEEQFMKQLMKGSK